MSGGRFVPRNECPGGTFVPRNECPGRGDTFSRGTVIPPTPDHRYSTLIYMAGLTV